MFSHRENSARRCASRTALPQGGSLKMPCISYSPQGKPEKAYPQGRPSVARIRAQSTCASLVQREVVRSTGGIVTKQRNNPSVNFVRMFFGFAREIVGVQPTKKNSLGTHRVPVTHLRLVQLTPCTGEPKERTKRHAPSRSRRIKDFPCVKTPPHRGGVFCAFVYLPSSSPGSFAMSPAPIVRMRSPARAFARR